mmetsp:Transcript_97674/g.280629  ORF Transcript_97674/g.280629 Transcript_97674/m.280629 type:complete len:317 (+) Transcript_97674:61-1011(+)|eukprot:CAMPEP_0177170972 /NCGR_PEP_ID=MMETSP0367-20130122/10377_1 /TAXON_ID=447022 ORGANISM="Scrippsiella hangoei-like, Strain SHHI-4" /NCGR_SAMPLE_ID=MMETSP0367 /ASSEMBLY_ACC=CAM_ASM_000362 /LENGTH=316 /DNA_ID=CAMNT_0018617193 /DNA_START=36 /DNA_END=989 /DNA_ORIENTATION=+
MGPARCRSRVPGDRQHARIGCFCFLSLAVLQHLVAPKSCGAAFAAHAATRAAAWTPADVGWVAQRPRRACVAGATRPGVASVALSPESVRRLAVSSTTSDAAFAAVSGGLSGLSELAWPALSGLAVLYVVLSFTEYAYHRFVQHLELNNVPFYQIARKAIGAPAVAPDFHINHHRETLQDMSIDPLPRKVWPEATAQRGTAATWWSFAKMSACIFMPAYPLLSLVGWSLPIAVLAVLAATLLHLMMYNSLHPQLHGLPDVSLADGPPSFGPDSFQKSDLGRWLIEYHVVHHRTRASRNFNVICPLFDQLLGTYAAA